MRDTTVVEVKGYTNGDDCFLAWIEPKTTGCRGFEIRRDLTHPNGKTSSIVLDNYVGFAKDHPDVHEHRPSTTWPLQRYTWTDHGVDEGDTVAYTITPMMVTPGGGLAPNPAKAGQSGPLHVTSAASSQEWAYFNRGVVLSQFMTRRLPPNFTHADLLKLKKDLAHDDNDLRRFLTGQLGARLVKLLDAAKTHGWHVYAALYELEDDRLIDGLIALGQNAHVILSNGSIRKKPGDGNADAATRLAGHVDLTRRMLWSAGLGHNKFLVVCKNATDPTAVWTGSTNWATTGLCTQMNNAILIRSVPIARTYLQQWHRLHEDELVAPDGKVKHFLPPLMTSNDQPKTGGQGASGRWTAWFTRTSKRQDIAAATAVINGAQKAILFLMFEPGSNGLRQVVEARMTPGAPTFKASLYIHGVVNTLHPGGGKVDVTTVAHGDTKTIDLRVIEPQGVATNLAEWAKEVTRQDFILGQGGVIGHAIIHSKIIVVDPFTKPVVITGSHNFSSPASGENDENLLIIRDSPHLAERYAVNIMSTYQHYRWRAYLRDCMVNNKPPFSALRDDDIWQKKLPEHNPELKFWLQK
jgi:hypothetical protein